QRSSDSSAYISSDTGHLFVFLSGGIVFLTLIVNGSTTQFFLHSLKMNKLSAAKRRILNFTKYEMLNKALQAFGDLGDDEELGPAEWSTVKRYIKSLNDVDGELTYPESSSENDVDLEHLNLKDIRVRLLNGVQAAYWEMLDEGRITQTMANLLMRSVDEAMDLVSRESLCDWKDLNSYVKIPSHYKFLQSSLIPQKLFTYFTVERLESACYICAAFLRAHRIARQQLRDFIGDNEVANLVIVESEQEGEQPRKFLEDVRINFPQVLRVVKTRQVTFSVLKHLIDYVHNLEKIGLLEEKEMNHLHDAVQTDLKMLMRNPPMVKLPKVRDLIAANPLLGALPSALRDSLAGSTKEIIKLSGTTFYREGSKPSGIWVISNGVVKWSSKSISSHSRPLHPTFTHGSTLGLYEVLTAKPYICDVIADSVVICFFLETETVLSACKSDPALEDFFWQESVIALAKLMLPHLFEKMPMQEFRTLIAERSTMNIYVSGESFELPHHHVGFLLEGFIKLEGGQGGLLIAPSALLTHSSVYAGTRGGLYHVEARSRIAAFDISGSESGQTFKRRQSSRILNSGDHISRSLDREHSGLMSWPHQFSKSKLDLETVSDHEMNLSSRAMQLSIYGSMVSPQGRSFYGSRPERRRLSQTHSSTRVVSSAQRRPLPSVRSEGSTTLRKKLLHHRSEPNVPRIREFHPNVTETSADDLSDDSGGEDEHIVRIDSPSSLSFQ
ncbi:hypothetical protein M569_11027, partial [Genlisea aurea]